MTEHPFVPHGSGERGQEVLPDVTLREGVQVPATKREVLDNRPVKRPPFLAEYREGRVQEVHVVGEVAYGSRTVGRRAVATSSTMDQSYTANGSEAGATMTSSTPFSAKRARRRAHSWGVPVRLSRE